MCEQFERNETYVVLRTIARFSPAARLDDICKFAQCTAAIVRAEIDQLSQHSLIEGNGQPDSWRLTERATRELLSIAEARAQSVFISAQCKQSSCVDIAGRLEWIDDMNNMIQHAKKSLDEAVPKS